MNRAKIVKWHRRLAWVSGIAVILWGMTGILHPVMTWTNPRPATFSPPQNSAAAAELSALRAALQKNGIVETSGLRVLDIGGKTAVQVTVPGQAKRVYLDARKGTILPDADKYRAIMLARHYTGLRDDKIKSAEIVTQFSDSYPYINRYLPAWQVTFDRPGNLTAWVETDTDRLGSLADDRKVALQAAFQSLHKGDVLRFEPLRLAVIVVLVAAVPLMAVFGLLLLLSGYRTRLPGAARRWHRVVAFAAWFPLLAFPASGLLHLLTASPLFYTETALPSAPVKTGDIAFMPRAGNLRLVSAPDGTAWWRAQDGEKVFYQNVRDGQTAKGDAGFTLRLSALFGDCASAQDAQKTETFTDEYGFANKRLPVFRVACNGALLFIEPRTATLAAKISTLDKVQVWSFGNLHKWQFLDPLSHRLFKNHAGRDAVMIFMVLIAVSGAVAGLFLRRRRKH